MSDEKDDGIEALLNDDAEPEPEPEAEPKGEEEAPPEPDEGEKPKPETVPLAALHEERSRRQELQEELRSTRDRMTRMETLWEKLQESREKAEPQLPDPEEDPDGYRDAKIGHLEKQLAELRGEHEKRASQDSQARESQQMMERYAADVRRFSAERQDFNDAYSFLGKAIDQDLQARGYDDPQERAAAIQYEEGMLVGRALKQGKSPAELIYNYAKSRGYKANGKDEAKLERLQKGQGASRTLSGAQAQGEGVLTLERLAELADTDPEAFDREWVKAQRQGLLG